MARIIDDEAGIAQVVQSMRRIAVLGIKTEQQADQAAFYVADYLAKAGLEVVPVPVYYPEVKEILGQKVYRTLAEIPGDLDLVNVFRRPSDVTGHLADLIAKKPKLVWMQLGIENDEVAKQLVAAGIDVVQNRCLMVDHRRHAK